MNKTTLSEADVHAFLRHAFGQVTGLHRLTEGEESQAFAFDAGGAFVLRINRDRAGFDKDRFVHRRFGPTLPIPEITLIAPLDTVWACVSRRIAGVTLQALPPGEAGQIAADVARQLDLMAACDVTGLTGAGPFDGTGRASCDSWGAWLARIGDRDWRHLPDMEPALNAVLHFARRCPDIRGLVHGDFGSNNVLADGPVISGVIDWSEAMIGDPLYDLANILFWRSWLTCMEEQAVFFETHQPWRLIDAERLDIYQLRIGLDTLWHAVQDADAALAVWVPAQIGAIMARLA